MESLELEVQNPRNLVVISDEGPDLTIRLNYAGKIESGMRLKGSLLGPGMASPLFIDQSAASLNIILSNDTFTEKGEYRFTGLRLEQNGKSIAVAEPRTTTIEAVDKLLVTGATVEEITQAEMAEEGFAFNEEDYKAIKFNVNLVMGRDELIETFRLLVPRGDKEIRTAWGTGVEVVRNPFRSDRLFVPLPAKSYQNRQQSPFENGNEELKPEWEIQEYEGYEMYSLLLIPGELSYFKGHFNVVALVLNDTPDGFDVRVSNLEAEISLPDPTRFGFPLKIRDQNGNPVRDVIRDSGNTFDSANYLDSGENGRASFLLTGEQPGMWDVQIDIRGEAALPQGKVNVNSSTEAKVLVRSREFAVSFEHPATIGELQDYEFKMNIFNKSTVPLEGVTVTLDPETLIGTELQPTTDPQQTLPLIPPGETGTLTFGMSALNTGTVTATYHRVHDGSDSSLALSIGIGNDGETLTHYSVAFPERFDDVVPLQLNQAFRVYAKKLIDFAQTEDDQLPAGIVPITMGRASSFFQGLSSAAMFLDWVSDDLGHGYNYDSDTALYSMIATYMDNQQGMEGIDTLRRHLLATSSDEWDLELAFSQILQARLATVDATSLLQEISYESGHLTNLRLAIVEGTGLDGLVVTTESGLTMSGVDTAKVRNIPYSGMFRLAADKILVWTGHDSEQINLQLPASAAQVNLSALLSNQAQKRFLAQTMSLDRSEVSSVSLANDGTLEALSENGLGVGEASYAAVNERPFALVGIRQLDPTQYMNISKFGQHRFEDTNLENGRWFVLAFSEPVDMSSMHPLDEHVSINGVGAFKAYTQQDPRLVVFVSSQIVGNNFPIDYLVQGVEAKSGKPMATSQGTFLGSNWLRGAYVRGRITDHHGTDLSKAKVYLTFAGKESPFYTQGRSIQNLTNFGTYIDVAEVKHDGTYLLPFVRHNRRFIDKMGERTTESGIPSQLNTAQLMAVLEDGRFKSLTFYPLTSGQEVSGDVVFHQLGTIWGEVRDEQGIPQAGVNVYVHNQLTPSGARLVTTDENGVYRVDNIEVGPVAVRTEVNGFLGMESGYLTVTNNPLRLDLQPLAERGHLYGRVTMNVDGVDEPVPNAIIAYSPHASTERSAFDLEGTKFEALAYTYANQDGAYYLPSIPSGQAVVRAIIPGVTAREENVIVAVNQETELNVSFQPLDLGGYVRGRVFGPDGSPQEDVRVGVATVLGGNVETKSDEDGYFELSPVLLNQNVKVYAFYNNQNGATLRGKNLLTLTYEQPTKTDLEIHLIGETHIDGSYVNFHNEPMAYRQVNMFSKKFGLEKMNLSDQQGKFTGTLNMDSPDMWVIGAVDYPRISYMANYILPGQTNQVLLRQRGYESIKVRMIDGHGNQVIGRILVQSELPDIATGLGIPAKVLSHSIFSDLDHFTTIKDLNYGSVTVWGEHPILGVTQRYTFSHGFNPNRDDLREIVLSFPRSEPGRLHGFVYNSDGTPAPGGTLVHATFNGVKATALCNSGGYYNFESLVSTIRPVKVDLFANHVDSERFASKTLVLNQNLNMRSDLILKGQGNVNVRVIDSDGSPVEAGDLVITYKEYVNSIPKSVRDAIKLGNYTLDGVSADDLEITFVNQIKRQQNVRINVAEPLTVFEDIPAGSLSVRAESGAGLAGFAEAAVPVDGGDIDVVVRLEAGSTIRGIFVDENDQPITDAQIDFNFRGYTLGAVTTNSPGEHAGEFEIRGLPMREYQLIGYQPDTNYEGIIDVLTSPFDPEPFVTLKLTPLGSIEGVVLMEDTGEPAVSANISLHLDHFRKIETATDENGLFNFGDLPLGEYPMEVTSLFAPGADSDYATISQGGEVAHVELVLGRGFDVVVRLRNDDGGLLPGEQVVLKGVRTGGIYKRELEYLTYTDTESYAVFRNIPRGSYQVSCNISEFGKKAFALFGIDGSKDVIDIDLTMPSLFTMRGNVRDSLGLVPSRMVTVTVKYDFGVEKFQKTATIDSNGDYFIPGLPYYDDIQLFAYDPLTGNTAGPPNFSHLESDGLEKQLDLELKAVTTASGVVLTAAGEPVANAPVWINKPTRVLTHTDSAGQFTLYPYIDDSQTVFAKDPDSPRRGALLLPQPERISTSLLPVTDQVIVLTPMFDIEGTVRLHDGEPLVGGEVTAVHQDTGARFRIPVQHEGYYYLEHLPAGSYELSVYDIIRREHLATPVLAESYDDNVLLQRDMTFQPFYYVAGRVFNAREEGEPNAVVEIFRNVPSWGRDRYFLVEALETNEDGFFSFEKIYPGEYRIRAENNLQTLSKSAEFVLGAASRQDISIELTYESTLLVSVKTPDGLPYQEGFFNLLRGSRQFERLALFSDGTAEIPRLTTEVTGYQLILNNGWSKLEGIFNLLPGPNFYEIIGPPVVKVTGRAIYQNESGGIPFVRAEVNGAGRGADILSDGYFELDQVPANQPVTLTLTKGSSKRTIEYAGFSQDTDLGTLLLNGGPPEVTPVAETLTVSSLPHTFEFNVTHPHDDVSILDPSKTSFSLGWNLSSFDVQTIDNKVLVTLHPDRITSMQRGEYYLRLNVAREDGLIGSFHQHIQIDPLGTAVKVTVPNNQEIGSYSLDQGVTWLTPDNPDYVVFPSMNSSQFHLIVRDPFQDQAGRLDLELDGTRLAMVESLYLRDYAGLAGTVYLPDGTTPAAGARVQYHEYWIDTDADGQYLIDYAALQYINGGIYLVASQDQRVAVLNPPAFAAENQILVDNDLVLIGRSQLELLAVQADGVTPAANATFRLRYDGFPYIGTWDVEGQVDENGRWLSSDIIATDFSVDVHQESTNLRGSAEGSFTAENTSETLTVTLEPAYQISGIALDSDGLPIEGATARYNRSSTGIFQETQTDANGAFTLGGIPDGINVEFKIYHTERGLFYREAFSNVAQDIDLGNLTLNPNVAPEVTSSNWPASFFVDVSESYVFAFSDDLGLQSVLISVTGSGVDEKVYERIWDSQWNPLSSSVSGNFRPAENIQAGTYTATVTITDILGQETTESYPFDVIEDVTGPQIAINSPLTTETFSEGDRVPFDIDASDINRVARIAVYWDEHLLGEKLGSTSFTFDAPAVNVQTAETVHYRVVAHDQAGNVSEVLHPVQIEPITTTQAPLAQLQYPMDGMPLPLTLASPLNMPIQFRLDDDVALQRYELWVNDDLLNDGLLVEADQTFNIDWQLPQELKTAAPVVFTLRVWNVGDQFSEVQATVNNIEGQVFNEQSPLLLAEFDQSQINQTIILDGGTHNVDGPHQFQNLIMVNGATLTQRETNVDDSWYAQTELTIDQDFVISPDSQLQMSEKGFYSTVPFLLVNNHGSHAGTKGTSVDFRGIYGSIVHPSLPGAGSDGGGYVAIHAPNVWVAGGIHADSERGSGGSIAIHASQSLQGFGAITTNGFNPSSVYTGSGGRIAVHAPQRFAGTLEAFTQRDNGAGTIYERIPDATYADGYREILTVRQRPDFSSSNQVGHTVLVGINETVTSEITIESNVQDAPEYAVGDVLRFPTDKILPQRYFIGYEVWVNGSKRTVINEQRINDLWMPANSLGTVVNGDLLEVRLPIDEVYVEQKATLTTANHPIGHVHLNEGWVIGLGITEATGLTVDGRGEVLVNDMRVPAAHLLSGQTLGLIGTLSIDQFTLDAGATIKEPEIHYLSHFSKWDELFTRMDLPEHWYQGFGEMDSRGISSHGGIGSYNLDVIGSPYQPETYSNRVHMHLKTQSFVLDGVIDNTYFGSSSIGGSVWVEGQTLTGSGHIDVDGEKAGGRAALIIDDVTGFTGQVTAYSDDEGAGTVFWRTAEQPLGRLVIDNGGTTAPVGSTLLDGIGPRTFSVDTSGTIVQAADLPDFNALAGHYLVVGEDDPIQIGSNTTTQINLSQPLAQTYTAGSAYTGRHVLDELVLAGGASLASVDPIYADKVTYAGGTSTAQITETGNSGGSFTLDQGAEAQFDSDPGYSEYVVDNATLVLNFPVNAQSITVRNNGTLRFHQPMQVNEIVVEDSTMVTAVPYHELWGDDFAVTATNITLQNATWRGWNSSEELSWNTWEMSLLTFNVLQQFSIDATSVVGLNENNQAQSYLDWYTERFTNQQGHAGIHKESWKDYYNNSQGSFSQPRFPAQGGAVRIKSQHLNLEGDIQCGHRSPGGSIWIDTASGSGQGRIIASKETYSYGGRIAIHHAGDGAFLSQWEILNHQYDDDDAHRGAGTIFLKSDTQELGTLRVDQAREAGSARSLSQPFVTGITGLKEITSALLDEDLDPLVIKDRSWNDLVFGMAGLWARFSVDGTDYQLQIADHTPDSMTFEAPADGILPPAQIPAGTHFEFVLRLDRLELLNGAMLTFEGIIETQELITDAGPYTNSLHCADLELPSPYTLANADFMLWVTDRDMSELDLRLEDTTLYTAVPMTLNSLELVRSTVTHPKIAYPYYAIGHAVDLTLQTLTMDETSKFDVSENHSYEFHSGMYNGYGSPGHYSNRVTYGSFLRPYLPGSKNSASGGIIRVIADTINGGTFLSNGKLYGGSGGSIWLEAQTLNGAFDIQANFGESTSTGGAGRISIYAADTSDATIHTSVEGFSSAGTLFTRYDGQTYGTLTIPDQEVRIYNNNPLEKYTPLPSFGAVTATADASMTYDSQADQTEIVMPNWTDKDDFSGYELVIGNDSVARHMILDHTIEEDVATFTLAGEVLNFGVGTIIRAGATLDAFETCADCIVTTGPLSLRVVSDSEAPQITALGLDNGRDWVDSGAAFNLATVATDNIDMDRVVVDFNGAQFFGYDNGAMTVSAIAPVVTSDTVMPLTVTAYDSNDNQTTSTLYLNVVATDVTQPTITIVEPTAWPVDGGSLMNVSVDIEDNRLLQSIQFDFNGETQTQPSDQRTGTFTTTFTAPIYGGQQVETLTITATDDMNNVATKQINVTLVDVTPPAEVTAVLPSITEDSITWDWTSPVDTYSDVAAIHVYLDGSVTPQVLAATATSYTYSGLTPGSWHDARIATVDFDGNESEGVSNTVATSQVGGGSLLTAPTAYYPMDVPNSHRTLADFRSGDHFEARAPHVALNGKTAITVAAWIKSEATSTGYLFDLLHHTSVNQTPLIRVGNISSGLQGYFRRDGGLNYSINTNSGDLHRDGFWHRLVFTADLVNGVVTLYLDGNEIGSRTMSATSIGTLHENFDADFYLGGYASTSYQWQGQIFDFQVWSDLWSTQDIQFDYDNGLKLVSERQGSSLSEANSLLARWLFNEGSGFETYDQTGRNLPAPTYRDQITWTGGYAPAPQLKSVVGTSVWQHQSGNMADGVSGSAMQLSAKSVDAANTPQSVVAPPPFSLQWSLNAFFLLESLPSAVGKAANLLEMGSGQSLSLRVDTQDQLVLDWTAGSQVLGSALAADTWYQLSLTVDGDQAQVYLDGAPLGAAITLPALPTYFTWRTGGDTAPFRLDELAYWTSLLSSNDITSIRTTYQNNESLFHATPLAIVHEAENLRFTPAASGLQIDWSAPDWSTADTITGYRLYLNGSSTPIELDAVTTSYLHAAYTATNDLSYRLSVLYGSKETQGVSGTFKGSAPPTSPNGIAAPDTHWDLESDLLGDEKLFFQGNNFISYNQPNDVFDGVTEATVTLWYRGGPATNKTRHLFNASHPSGANNPIMRIYEQTNGEVLAIIRRTSGSLAYLRSPIKPLDLSWHKVHAVANWNTGSYSLYLDGELVDSASYPTDVVGPIATGTSARLSVGANSGNSWGLDEGYITEAQIWTKAFDQDDITFDLGNYRGKATDRTASTLQTSDLKAYWPLTGDDTSMVDATGNGYDLQPRYSNTWQLPGTEPMPAVLDLVQGAAVKGNGAAAALGKAGNGLATESKAVGFETPATWQSNAGFSASVFYKPTATPQADTQLLSRTTDQGTFSLWITKQGQLKALLPDGALASAEMQTTLSDWVHLTVTYAADGDLTVYLKGHAYLEIADTGAWTDPASDWFLAGDGITTARRGSGSFDEITTWNRVLTAAEVAGVYNIYQNNDTLANALNLGSAPAPTPDPDDNDEPSNGEDDKGGNDSDDLSIETQSLPEGATQIGEQSWELRNQQAVVENLVVDGDFWLIGGKLTVQGEIRARSIFLREGAVLTLQPKQADEQPTLVVNLTGTLDVDARSHINLDGVALNATALETNLAHAGYALAEDRGQLKGALLMPQAVGGGHQGGGAFYLSAQSLNLDGQLTARGLGASAGGSIWLELGELQGMGLIDVSGGQADAVIAGGGRVAVYSDSVHRFSGRIVTGLNPETEGSLIFAKRDGSDLVADLSFPWQQRLPELPQALEISRGEVETLGRNSAGELLKVTQAADLTRYKGAWFDNGIGRARILEVVAIDDNTYLVQVVGTLTDGAWQSLKLVIEARQPQAKPNRIPFVPKR